MQTSFITPKLILLTALSFVICHLSCSPARAQVGTWHNYLAYYDVQQIQDAGDNLFVMASNDLYQYNKNDQSIITYDKVNGLSDTHIALIQWCKKAKRLIAVYSNANIDLVETNTNVINISDLYTKAITGDKTVNSIAINGQYAYLACGFGIVKINVKQAEISESYMLGFSVSAIAFDTDNIYAQSATGIWKGALADNLIDKSNWHLTTNAPSFQQDNSDYDNNIALVKTLKPGGPKHNYFGFLRFKHEQLYTCGGGFSIDGELNRDATIQILNNGEWTCLQDNIAEITGWRYIDMLVVDADPNDPNHIFGGGETGLYEFQNGSLLTAHNIDNSPLESNIGNLKDYVFIEGMTFDEDGNLWITNIGAPTQSLLEYTKDKKWIPHQDDNFYIDKDGLSLYGLKSLCIDSNNLLWLVNYHHIKPSFYCYDMVNKKVISSFDKFVNQDGTSLGEQCFPRHICEDKDGNMWIATTTGPLVLEKANIYTSNSNLVQVKVPRNDGTNYADYLLNNVNTSCIVIDGGNRKWIGTIGNGIYLISADNMTEIHHFTVENSPILSNNVESLAINPKTGELYIGTDQGLCSYVTDATETNTEMTKDNIWAYPNPVNPGYTGPITITGLTYNADVKILSSNGAVVNEGRSNGGTYIWDGCDKQGRRVASGVYMVAIATKDGEKGVVTKIAIIN
jgi:ligand-binding sensor domain-containing protein